MFINFIWIDKNSLKLKDWRMWWKTIAPWTNTSLPLFHKLGYAKLQDCSKKKRISTNFMTRLKIWLSTAKGMDMIISAWRLNCSYVKCISTPNKLDKHSFVWQNSRWFKNRLTLKSKHSLWNASFSIFKTLKFLIA